MDFRYTPHQAGLKARAAAYTELLMRYENQSEEAGGPLPADTVRELTRAAIDAGVYAINMPEKWGGPGLSLLDQVIVEEEFGKVTNCLWDIPWRPANVLAYGTEAQREKYLLPVIRGSASTPSRSPNPARAPTPAPAPARPPAPTAAGC